MNIINYTSARRLSIISITERAMELEQKPERSLYSDKSSYHGSEHVTLYLDYHSAHKNYY